MADLAEHPLVYYIEGLVKVEDLADLPPHSVAIGSTSVFCQLEATRAGAGLGLLPRFVAQRHPELVPVLPELVRPRLTYVASLAPAKLRRPGAREVLGAIRSEMACRAGELMPPLGGVVA